MSIITSYFLSFDRFARNINNIYIYIYLNLFGPTTHLFVSYWHLIQRRRSQEGRQSCLYSDVNEGVIKKIDSTILPTTFDGYHFGLRSVCSKKIKIPPRENITAIPSQLLPTTSPPSTSLLNLGFFSKPTNNMPIDHDHRSKKQKVNADDSSSWNQFANNPTHHPTTETAAQRSTILDFQRMTDLLRISIC